MFLRDLFENIKSLFLQKVEKTQKPPEVKEEEKVEQAAVKAKAAPRVKKTSRRKVSSKKTSLVQEVCKDRLVKLAVEFLRHLNKSISKNQFKLTGKSPFTKLAQRGVGKNTPLMYTKALLAFNDKMGKDTLVAKKTKYSVGKYLFVEYLSNCAIRVGFRTRERKDELSHGYGYTLKKTNKITILKVLRQVEKGFTIKVTPKVRAWYGSVLRRMFGNKFLAEELKSMRMKKYDPRKYNGKGALEWTVPARPFWNKAVLRFQNEILGKKTNKDIILTNKPDSYFIELRVK